MTKFFKKNSKKVMAVLGVILMIAFFAPTNRTSSRGETNGKVVATIFNGQKINATEMTEARAEWDLLRSRLFSVDMRRGRLVPLTESLGAGPASAINAKPETFLILIKEAQQDGVTVSNDQLQGTLKNYVKGMPEEGDPTYDRARQAVNDLMLVANLLDRVRDDIRISQPAALRELTVARQDVSVNVVEISAKDYLRPPATQPTTREIEEVKNLYDSYSQQLPGERDIHNPLGFGYRYPDRVKLQYIGITQAELRDAVKRTKAPFEWDVEARRLYRPHPEYFFTPATRASTTGPATTEAVGPTTAPAWEMASADLREKVFNKVYDDAAQTLSQDVQKWLGDQLADDWAAYHEAVTHGSPPPVNSTGFAYNTPDYLKELSLKLQAKFGVEPIIGFADNGWKSAKDLALLPEIGLAETDAPRMKFGDYATTHGDQLNAASKIPPAEQLAQWQPSRPLHTDSALGIDGTFIFMLTGMDASHPAPYADVLPKVIQDVQLKHAWEAASAEAEKLLTVAKAEGLQSAANRAVPSRTMFTTGFFNSMEFNQPLQDIPRYPLDPQSVQTFAYSSMQLMTQSVAGAHKPVGEVELPVDLKIDVIELDNTRPPWTSLADRATKQAEMAEGLYYQNANAVCDQWATFNQAAKRTQYKEVAKSE